MDTSSKENTVKKLIDKRGKDDAIERQRLITYLVATGLVVVGMTMHLSNILGANAPVLRSLSLVILLACVVTFILWMADKVKVRTAFNITSVLIQLIQTAKILFISIGLGQKFDHLVVMNGVISMMLMTLLAISYMPKMTIGVGVANALTLIAAGFINDSRVLWQYIILIIMFTFFFTIMADLMYRNVKQIKDENIQFQTSEQNFLNNVRLNRKEIRAYLAMCRTENPADEETDRLFGMLSEKSQRNVINAVERKKALDNSREDDIKAAFPDFTPMELEVSRLILQGMKLSQIINITGKSESNISVVRSRIRKKLGLASGEDLYDALQNKIGSK